MSRQLEARIEEASRARQAKVLEAVYGGLYDAVGRAGGELTGLNVKWDGAEVLLVIKAVFPGGPMVGFVGAEDLAGGLVKAAREAVTDSIKWRADKWARKEG